MVAVVEAVVVEAVRSSEVWVWVRGRRACSVAKRRSTSTLATLKLPPSLLSRWDASQSAWVRIRCGLSAKACEG